mmetsp:Transcript_24110/g.69582  ORF Transcript_24110/g.69582 Transcript_24110/m.69582 type:complete len:83 (-) Transcript_24110:113-361(-)
MMRVLRPTREMGKTQKGSPTPPAGHGGSQRHISEKHRGPGDAWVGGCPHMVMVVKIAGTCRQRTSERAMQQPTDRHGHAEHE